jgi:hypothetical protein
MARGDFKEHIPRCPIACPQGCGEKVTRANVTEHLTVCPNVQVPCTAKEIGCIEIMPRGDMQKHLRECRYEQLRWIIEPLRQETISLRQDVDHLQEKYETILQQLVTLTTKSHVDQLSSTVPSQWILLNMWHVVVDMI